MRTHPVVQRNAGRLAAALAAAGLGAGDRVVVLVRNDIEFLEAHAAVSAIGANPIPVNTHWQPPELAHVLRDSAARLVIAHTEFVPIVERALAATVTEVPVLEVEMAPELLAETGLDPDLAHPTGRYPTMREWIDARPEPIGHRDGAIADSMGVVYTSGTTGSPKGVLREPMAAEQLLSIAGAAARRMGVRPGGQLLVAGPLYHTSPNAVAVLGMRMGTNITIMPRFDAERFLHHIDTHGIEQAKIVPTMLSRLLSLPAEVRARYDVSSLTHLIHSAAPCPPAIKRAAIEWFGDAVWEYYGCSEAGTITWISADEWSAHSGSVGRPVDGSSVVIADASGNPLSQGEIGRVFVRGADYWPKFRYLNHGTTDSPVGGHISVGDIGYLDDDGFLFLTGRSSEIIISGGVNIYPAEIEAALAEIEGVEDAAVFGIADVADRGEAVAADVVERPGAALTTDALRGALRGRLAAYKIPSRIRIVAELPRDESGKINKRVLREHM
ncbi:AMP-binding protein [Nocardia callitridis]|uniref:AMP-binding protein n=1 Tax=Nocardia callitridis TaxID=648753 RepID=UPI0031E78213